MDLERLDKISETEWHISPQGKMRVPGIIFASEPLVRAMDEKVAEQTMHVACLPGIEVAAFAMPDAHWGYGFPIGGVAAFDPEHGGIISAGGVGFDISCGVRMLTTELEAEELEPQKEQLADALFAHIPAGLGKRSRSPLHLDLDEIDAMLRNGAVWAVKNGYGKPEDLLHIEERGCMLNAEPSSVSEHAKRRQLDEVGTLGSGNHYLEVQQISDVYDETTAQAFGLYLNSIVISIHCGSRGLGHQIGTEFLRRMAIEAPKHGLDLPDRELASAPLTSQTGEEYLGAMRAGINCALANRQVLTHFAREVFADLFPKSTLRVLYDVSHNTCKVEEHKIDGRPTELFVHRKGATRAFGPGHPSLPEDMKAYGQPVLIGGSMGTCSYVLAGTSRTDGLGFNSSCHGAGRSLSRHQATKQWGGREVVSALAEQGILIRSMSYRGVAEEAPGAYKDVTEVVNAAERAGLSRKVAKVVPLICVKG